MRYLIWILLVICFKYSNAQSTACANIRAEVIKPAIASSDTIKNKKINIIKNNEGQNIVYKDTLWANQKKTVKIINIE